ncbi:unnamed protein product [Cuscuta epithymum]|nr:unnamed protein product [Cuscuta epithymum]
MVGDNQPSKSTIHPALTLNNIKTHIPITLDLKDDEYSSWVFLFELHLEAHNLMFLIDGEAAPSTIDGPTRKQLDALVRQWMFSTMSKDLMLTVLKSGKTAKDLWDRLKSLFQDNKGTRAALIEIKFVNLKFVDCSSVDDYCDKLHTFAERLQDLGFAMDDKRLVIQLVNGLPPEYDTVASLISQTMPSFEAARSQLRTEEKRRAQQSAVTSPTALVVPASPSAAAYQTEPSASNQAAVYQTEASASNRVSTPTRQPRISSNHRRSRSNNRRPMSSDSSGHSSPGRFLAPGHSPAGAPLIPGYPSPWQPFWAIPPCPYPTASPGPLWTPSPGRLSGARGSSGRPIAAAANSNQGQAYFTPTAETLHPEDLAQAYSSLSLKQPDNNFYMDTGATSHLTADSGPDFGDMYYEMQ